MPAETPDVRRILGPLALRLGPRALPARGPSRVPTEPETCSFALRADGLRTDGPALESLAGAHLAPFVRRGGPSASQVLLQVPRTSLEAAAHLGDEAAELLLSVQAALNRPPPRRDCSASST